MPPLLSQKEDSGYMGCQELQTGANADAVGPVVAAVSLPNTQQKNFFYKKKKKKKDALGGDAPLLSEELGVLDNTSVLTQVQSRWDVVKSDTLWA